MAVSDVIVVALISAVIALVGIFFGRKKDDAETSDKISAAWDRLNKPLLMRVEQLERREAIWRERDALLWQYVDDLRSLLRRNNIEAPPLPKLPIVDDKE